MLELVFFRSFLVTHVSVKGVEETLKRDVPAVELGCWWTGHLVRSGPGGGGVPASAFALVDFVVFTE